MKIYIPIFLFLLFTACVSNKPEQTYSIPTTKDIYEIINAVIYQYHLPVLKNTKILDTIYGKGGKKIIMHRKSYPLCVNLTKWKVLPFKDTSMAARPLPPNTISIESLFSKKVGGKNFFNKSDSSYLIFLNDTLLYFRISKQMPRDLLLTTDSLEHSKIETKRFTYYSMAIPIFSKNNKKAYTRITFRCFLCGYETGIFLKKIDNKWKIVKVQKLSEF